MLAGMQVQSASVRQGPKHPGHVVVVVVDVVVVVVVVVVMVVVVVVVVVVGVHGVPAHPGQSASWTLTLPWSSGMVAGQALHGSVGNPVSPFQPIMSGLSSAST